MSTYVFSVQLLPIPLNPSKALRAWLRVEKGRNPCTAENLTEPLFQGGSDSGGSYDRAKQIHAKPRLPIVEMSFQRGPYL